MALPNPPAPFPRREGGGKLPSPRRRGAGGEGCAIDWSRRYAVMCTHTAMHILCGVVWRDYGASVTGGNMDPLEGRMDFEFATLRAELVGEIETKCNAEIAAACDVRVRILPWLDAFAYPLPDPHQDQPPAGGDPSCAYRGDYSWSTSRPTAVPTSPTRGRSGGYGLRTTSRRARLTSGFTSRWGTCRRGDGETSRQRQGDERGVGTGRGSAASRRSRLRGRYRCRTGKHPKARPLPKTQP